MAVETENNFPSSEANTVSEPADQADLEPQDQSSAELEAADPLSTAEDQAKPAVENPPADKEPAHLNRILNMKVPIIVRIAKKKMKVSEVMKLNIGTVIQFDQDAYQYIDLMVNNEVIGLGQPVKLGEKFGLKITEFSDITHTIKSLGGGSESGS